MILFFCTMVIKNETFLIHTAEQTDVLERMDEMLDNGRQYEVFDTLLKVRWPNGVSITFK